MSENPYSKYLNVSAAAALWNGNDGPEALKQREEAVYEHTRDGDYGAIEISDSEGGFLGNDALRIPRTDFMAWLRVAWPEDYRRITGERVKMLTATEASARMGISRTTFYRRLKLGKVPPPAEPGPPPLWAENQI